MNYTYHQKQILRTPLEPIKTSFTKEELAQLFTQKDVQEALFLSSPNLLNEFAKWQKGELTDKEEEKRLIFSLLKYALRMHSRCTPFGLFAGCGVVELVEDTTLTHPQPLSRGEQSEVSPLERGLRGVLPINNIIIKTKRDRSTLNYLRSNCSRKNNISPSKWLIRFSYCAINLSDV